MASNLSDETEWYHDGKTHIEEWYFDGIPHRLNGPAIISNGQEEWRKNGKLHRHEEDGPAVTYKSSKKLKNGRKEWWKDGKLHRENAPAVVWDNGNQEWWYDGKRHREDGPAIIFPNEIRSWDPDPNDQWFRCLSNKPRHNDWNHRKNGEISAMSYAIEEWWKNGVRHRDNGPAIVEKDGSEAWYFNGILQTSDNLAREWEHTSHVIRIDKEEHNEKERPVSFNDPSIKTSNNVVRDFEHHIIITDNEKVGKKELPVSVNNPKIKTPSNGGKILSHKDNIVAIVLSFAMMLVVYYSNSW